VIRVEIGVLAVAFSSVSWNRWYLMDVGSVIASAASATVWANQAGYETRDHVSPTVLTSAVRRPSILILRMDFRNSRLER
jgi:hypothetical protein